MEPEKTIPPQEAENDNSGRAAEPVAEAGNTHPTVKAGPSLLHVEHVAQLVEALRTYAHERRQTQGSEESGPQLELLRASCLAVITGSIDTEGGETLSAEDIETLQVLQTAGAEAMPEARVCRVWLSLSTKGPNASAIAELESLPQQPLWEPVQAIAYRVLAHFGRRRTLAMTLPANGPLSLSQADAWLDAAHIEDISPDWINRITVPTSDLRPPAVVDGWLRLLRAETDLAAGRNLPQIEVSLLELSHLAEGSPPRSYATVEARIIAARAAAARKRLYLAGWQGMEPTDGDCGDQWIPAWERLYLEALIRWYHEDLEESESLLNSALALAPLQTPVRLALASLQAVRESNEALDTLSADEPTREILVARAAILARLGRYEDAQSTLSKTSMHPMPGREPLRYCWPRGQSQLLRQEYSLRTALAELRHDWATARDAWRNACRGDRWKTLYQARELCQAVQELATMPDGKGLRRDMARQRLDRGRRELGNRPLLGDARYFRAVAMAATQPEQALLDARTLLRQRSWVNGELRAGSGRLVCVGDLLMRLGQTDEAIRAYELASRGDSSLAKERLAIAQLYRVVQEGGSPQLLEAAVGRTQKLAPNSPWLSILASLAFVIADDIDSAMARADTAGKQGATDLIHGLLGALYRAVRGEPLVDDVDITALRLSPKAEVLVRLLGTCGTASDRLQAFLQVFAKDWADCCPFDPIRVVRRLAADPSSTHDFSRLRALVNELLESSTPGAVELTALVRVVQALNMACDGKLEMAVDELYQVVEELRH